MALFQDPPRTEEELARSKPLDIPPSEVLKFDEKEWYERAFRGENVPQLTVRAVLMGSVLGFFLSFTNIYVGLKTGWFLGVAITACILSFTIWSGLLKIGFAKSPMTILETNCMQSTASAAGYATGNSLVTAFPAMLMLSVSTEAPGGIQSRVADHDALGFLSRDPRRVPRDPDEAKHDQPREAHLPFRNCRRGHVAVALQRRKRGARARSRAFDLAA